MNRRLTKRDIEGFLSAFNYNKYGATKIDDVGKLVFARHDEIQDALAHKRRANAPPEILKNEINLADVAEDQMHNKRIRGLMTQLEDKVFHGKLARTDRLYQVFKKFDKDGDGYVSYDDFENALKGLHVEASKDEVSALLKHVDKADSGYLNFSSFSKVFDPNMASNLVKVSENESHFRNNVPNANAVGFNKE